LTIKIKAPLHYSKFGTIERVFFGYPKRIQQFLKQNPKPTSILLRYKSGEELWVNTESIVEMKNNETELTEEEIETFWMGPNSQRNYFAENSAAFIIAAALVSGFLYAFVLFAGLIT